MSSYREETFSKGSTKSTMGSSSTASPMRESDPLLKYHSSRAHSWSSNHSSPLHSSRNGIFSSIRERQIGGGTRANTTNQKSGGDYDFKDYSYRVHKVSYTAQNHVQILFQMYGSALPQVLPFCLANIFWTLVVYVLKEQRVVDMTFGSVVGHSFMGLLVSFLVVARSRISYDRFFEMRRYLAVAYRTCREIAQFTAVYTMTTQTEKARAWRQQVAYRTILLLRVTMDALRWSSTERHLWERSYFDQNDNNDNKKDDDDSDDQEVDNDTLSSIQRLTTLHHGQRTMIDENFRAPIVFSHILRETVMRHPTYLGYTMPVNEYRDLLHFVTAFNEAFHGFRVLIFTPYPFPLVQMTRLFLFFWVYSLPLVLLEELRSICATIIIVALITFGFVGIEYVSMALDDPFGDDTNDVDEHGMALLVYEDVYLAIYRTDGAVAAQNLRERVIARYKLGRGLDCYRQDLRRSEFWEGHDVDDSPV